MKTTPQLSRRFLLKGLGATLTLPWMESLAWASGAPDIARPPMRWATLLFCNGVNEAHWWAREQPGGIAFSSTLEPLQPHQSELLVLNGLHIKKEWEFMGHFTNFTNFLSGATVERQQMPDAAESLDQYLARKIGHRTSIPVLNLGIEPVHYGMKGGLPSIYAYTFSWSSPTTPVAPEVYPRQAFDRLFDISGHQRHQSVLDTVLDLSKGVERKLGRRDRDKLDQYLTSVREVERRIERVASGAAAEGWQPTLTEPNLPRPEAGREWSLPEHTRLMLDLLVLAFQMDKTRIGTFLFQSDQTNAIRYDFLPGVPAEGMHSISHHSGKQDKLDAYQKINRFHVEQFAYVLEKMRAIDEGGSTLLDNSMLLFGSSLMDGNSHDCVKVPLILAGRGGGTIRPGRVLDYETDAERRICNLHLASLHRMGIEDSYFGNSTAPLSQLI